MKIDPEIEYKACSFNNPKNHTESISETDVNVEINQEEEEEDKEKDLYEQFQDFIVSENSYCSRKFPQKVNNT